MSQPGQGSMQTVRHNDQDKSYQGIEITRGLLFKLQIS